MAARYGFMDVQHASRIMADMQRHHHQPVSLEQAAQEAPVLGQLMRQIQLSQVYARSIAELVPTALRPFVSYGAVEDGEWCVLVPNSAAAAKVRQLLPLWQAHLRQQGLEVQRIRLRVQGGGAILR